MTEYLDRRENLRSHLPTVTTTIERYGILVDTERLSVVVIRFFHHQELLDLVLSDDYPSLLLYRTQYERPSDEDLEELNHSFFSKRSK